MAPEPQPGYIDAGTIWTADEVISIPGRDVVEWTEALDIVQSMRRRSIRGVTYEDGITGRAERYQRIIVRRLPAVITSMPELPRYSFFEQEPGRGFSWFSSSFRLPVTAYPGAFGGLFTDTWA